MKRKALRKSHDDLVRLLRHVIRKSERKYGADNRTPDCQRDYLRAKKLLAEVPRATDRR